MKHSDLKVGMKVKRVRLFGSGVYASIEGNISTVKEIYEYYFTVQEDNYGAIWDAEYFEPVEEAKEKEIMNTESNLISMQCADSSISLDKKYKTRCGYPVRVLCVDRKDTVWPVVAMYQEQNSEGVSFHKINGAAHSGRDFDLIEVSPYEDFKKDDKVMVSHDGTRWIKRYFSHEENGVPYVFQDGMTSWSNNYSTVGWEFCRKPTQEELGE